MFVGGLGAALGGILGRAVGLDIKGEPSGFAMSLIGAFTFMAAYNAITFARRQSAGTP
jgi:hypothetical protein